jgi:hypothetical protein
LPNNAQNHPAAASDFAKCEKRTTAARVHFIVMLFNRHASTVPGERERNVAASESLESCAIRERNSTTNDEQETIRKLGHDKVTTIALSSVTQVAHAFRKPLI